MSGVQSAFIARSDITSMNVSCGIRSSARRMSVIDSGVLVSHRAPTRKRWRSVSAECRVATLKRHYGKWLPPEGPDAALEALDTMAQTARLFPLSRSRGNKRRQVRVGSVAAECRGGESNPEDGGENAEKSPREMGTDGQERAPFVPSGNKCGKT
jgi:hypothetical protein